MSVTVIIGAQWGDEAKGKMADLLSQSADIVARFNGGDNAGHTVVNKFGTFKLRLTPNGIANPHTQCVIGPGVALNLGTLIKEIEAITNRGIAIANRLWVSPRCSVVMPYHPIIESIYEQAKGSGRTGTTGRGMGPVYADKVSYNSIRLADFADVETLRARLSIQLAVKNRLLQAFELPPLDLEQVLQEKLAEYAQVQHVVREPFGMLQAALAQDRTVILEGAQGTLLDNDWGTYPYCTASTTLSGGAAAGLGVAPKWIQRVLGVAKAYTTRVGAGPMPTELLDATGDSIRNGGAEFGTVTGRPRRCGWFDAALVRFTAQVNGFTELALTKLDVLDGLPTVKIGVGYRLKTGSGSTAPGNVHQYWEGDAHWLENVEPAYIELPGWQAPTQSLTSFAALPPQAQAYVNKIEELVGVPVKYVSTGPGRDQTILRS